MQGTFSPRCGDVKQTPFLLKIAFPVNGAFVGEESIR
jgi:hypothetical protein